ncbi:MAG TPA: PKD domain-containing protein [Candidatus Poseidoniaceae archaeon]|nr:MAG TPA: PKD domain-containing protein [Candidatus Poseidoniales archaeon]HII31667.1 PKD domain-containing protein [Candidatus Poseidoniaceae archaeon]|tara:strand:- start:4079 stop:5254 length:1176 start_codon:yes stop_codon:yes gene_type:complete
MQGKSMPLRGLLLIAMMVSISFAGCLGALDTTVQPRASLEAYPLLIQEGEMVTFDARDSDAIEGVITAYRWNFGDGEKSETVTGFTSHIYDVFGAYTVSLEVENDQGGIDEAITIVIVNGVPTIDLTFPENPRAGDAVLLDASGSTDPESAELAFSWDLDWGVDSDGDGDGRNDVDSTEPQTLLPTNTSGIYVGSLTVDDGQGGVVTEVFEVNVSARQFNIEWKEKVIQQSWSEYLDEGEEWTEEILPGQQGRILSFEAVLELENDVIQPYDNFSLIISIPGDGFKEEAETEGGNITQSENAKATITANDLNSRGLDEVIEADSKEMVMQMILDRPGQNFGQSPWALFVRALQTNPDSTIDILPDPDPGNDWTLTLRIVVHEPVITEIAFE